ncbi:MAG: ABC transporter permease subunit [Gammaproteobacteria bacterium]|nr:ABC transporter permease subunit [Gammaproteobacteria bacterium]MDH3769057.1 ABC transporter permease subunit [Gammaproteobacteria bacterium]
MKQLAAFILLCALCLPAAGERIVVGSKTFTESYLLAEIMSQLLEASGYEVERKYGFGGTLVCYQALVNGEIDVYPEYTGTISETILHLDPNPSPAEVDAALSAIGLQTLTPIGFNNTYAIAAGPELATRLGLQKISDLGAHPQLRLGFSHEFRDRDDGWPGLAGAYGLNMPTRGIEHGLAYRAIADGSIDITDAYSTDGDIARYQLVLLDDDRQFFPRYDALALARRALPSVALTQLERLAGQIDDAKMRQLNSSVVVEKKDIAVVARTFLATSGLVENRTGAIADNAWRRLLRNIVRHLQLTVIALLLACLVGVPVAILIHRSTLASGGVLYVAGLLQTIPSIALLALMIPLFGVGVFPAIIALFLYSLLPILRNTTTALKSIDPVLRRVATGMGLTTTQQVKHVIFPLAMPNVLAGIRTAAIISIGTATLAAFIGAGGLGEPIVTGLALNDTNLILQGAIPAALLALGTEILFELIERRLIPAHLR